MKRTLLMAMAATTLAANGNAQGFYLRAGLGYAFPQAAQTMDGSATAYNGTITSYTQNSTSYTTYNVKKASFNTGMQFNLGLGYMINQHVGIDGAFTFALSATSYNATYNNILLNSVPSDLTYVQKAKALTLFTPSLVLQTGKGKATLYSRTGIVLPLNTTITQDQISTNLPGTGAVSTEDDTWEIKNKFSMGFAAALGVKYKLSDKVKVTGELSFVSLSVFTKQSDVKRVTIDGQEYDLSLAPDSIKHVIYSNSFTTTSSNYYKQPTYSMPFSNLAFNIGIVFSLGNHDERSEDEGEDKKGKRATNGYFHH